MAKPHYHRRMRVSLLSSGWDQVGPRRYGRQGRGGSSAVAPAPHLLEKVDPWSRSASSVSGNSRGINRKRVTSVEVNSNQTLLYAKDTRRDRKSTRLNSSH